jgi:tripartite-type tricarboxylate transporter receptor subunit TctC
MINRRTLLVAGATTAAALLPAHAQGSFPNRTVRIIVPTAAGGGNDVIARTIAEKMATSLGQPVVVENRVGGSSVIANDFVAKSAPDGHTILFNGPLIVQTAGLLSKLPYDPLTDFIPITEVIRTPLWLAVNAAKLPSGGLPEYIAAAKARPADFPYASIGPGSSHHLYGFHFNEAAGLSLTHVPYKGGAPAIVAVVGGEVASVFLDYVSLKPHVESGRVRLLATTGTKRSPLTPAVPTLAELGYTGFESYGWGALFVPAKTPPEAVARIHSEVVSALRHPDVIARFAGFGFELGGTPQAQFATQFRGDYDRWTALIRKAGAKLD